MPLWNPKSKDADTIVTEARRHVGYRAQPNRVSNYQIAPYGGKAWNGTFVDRVLHDALGDFSEVRFISTVSALSFYVKTNRLFQRGAQPGDIVFFNFATDPLHPFEQPHVGVVTELRSDGSFRTVEGETGPGTPHGSQLVDGVFERVRFPSDVLGYVRPKARTVRREDGEPTKLKLSYFASNPTTKTKAFSLVETALRKARPTLPTAASAKGAFKSVFGLYARETGTVENRGELNRLPLNILADESGTFEVVD